MGTRGWHSRGYLPHFDAPGLVQSLTFHLADSLPKSALARMETQIEHLPEAEKPKERKRRLECFLDAGYGACWLRQTEIAQLVEDRILQSDGEECLLLAWTIMPNHVHVLCELSDEVPLAKLLKDWKGSAAVAANRWLSRTGAFWYREYHDRYIRDEVHFRNAVRYIDENPVKAGLCRRPNDWPFGSARRFSDAE
ncbi:transposase [soil metagenome]